MYVRLAFAVAAHLQSDILIVDEVLAVGDAEFQKKCLGKMGEVSAKDGKTILFVSHNMGAIMQLCRKGILLKNGTLTINSTINHVIEKYLQLNQQSGLGYIAKDNTRNLYIKSVTTKRINGSEADSFRFDEEIILDISLCVKRFNSSTKLSVTLQNSLGDFISTFVEDLPSITDSLNDNVQIEYKLPHSLITPNSYSFRLALFIPNSNVFDLIELVCPIRIIDSGTRMAAFEGINYGNFTMKYTRL
jgi:lipopolysaccharide transport system ATP-binding protein